MRVNRINRLLFIFIIRQPHDPYLVDSPVCHFQYGYVEAIRDEMIAFLWHALEDPHDPSADRKDVKFFVNIELFIHLVDACRSGHEVFVFGNFLDFLYNRIMLASFNPQLAAVRGVAVKTLDYLFVILVTLITVAAVASMLAAGLKARICTLDPGKLDASLGGHDFDEALLAALPLPDATKVLPGHEDFTTLGQERRSNPYMNEAWF